jgi:transposase
MIYVRQPSDEERTELQRMTRQEVGRVSQRAHMVLLSTQRRTVPEIALIFTLRKATVRQWLHRFDVAGPAGLHDEARSGRPRKVTAAVRDTLDNLVAQDPAQSGYLATFWTVAMLVLALTKKLGVYLSRSTVRHVLQTLDLRWGRPRLAMPAKVDPQKAAQQWAIAQAVVEAGPEAALLYADESRIALLPLLRAMWHRLGQQVRIPTPGSNVSRALFGALNIRTGRWVYQVHEHMYKEDFIAFLEQLLLVYATGVIILIVDNYSSHTAGDVKTWLAEHPRLQLFYLPKYCSHLNPVECIWLRLKGALAANRLHGSMPALLDAVDDFFTGMTAEQALTWAAA